MKINKRLLCLAVGTLLMFSLFSSAGGEATDLSTIPSGGKTTVTEQKGNKSARQRIPYTMEEKIRILQGRYDISKEEAISLLGKDISFRTLDKICFWSVISRRPAEDVMALKKDNPWDRLSVLLKVSPQAYHDRRLALRANQIHRWWGFDEKSSFKAMQEGYPMHYVKIAWILSKHTGKPMKFFLEDRKASESWKSYCKRTLGISEDMYDTWIDEYRNPTWIPGKG